MRPDMPLKMPAATHAAAAMQARLIARQQPPACQFLLQVTFLCEPLSRTTHLSDSAASSWETTPPRCARHASRLESGGFDSLIVFSLGSDAVLNIVSRNL